jgi:hypothetical protein
MSDFRVAFIGPCHTTGYPGVGPGESFPEVARAAVEAARPGIGLQILTEPCYHPADLPRAARRAARQHPAIAVVEAVGWFAVRGSQAVDLGQLPRGLRSTYDRVRYLRHVSAGVRRHWPVARTLVAAVETTVAALADGPMRSLLPRLPRPTLAEYEERLDAAVRGLRTDGIEVVIEGPARLSDQLPDRALPPDAAVRYGEVNRMARAVAARHQAVFVDRMDATPGTPLFYLPGSVRPSRAGHQLWGRLLADSLLRSGLV